MLPGSILTEMAGRTGGGGLADSDADDRGARYVGPKGRPTLPLSPILTSLSPPSGFIKLEANKALHKRLACRFSEWANHMQTRIRVSFVRVRVILTIIYTRDTDDQTL